MDNIKRYLTSGEFAEFGPLRLRSEARKFGIATLIGLAVFSLLAVNFVPPEYIVAMDVAVIIVLAMAVYPLGGLCLIVLLYPFNNWQLVWGGLNAPYVDLAALFLFVAVALRSAVNFVNEPERQGKTWLLKKWPAIIFAGLFFAASALAIVHNYPDWASAVKYLLRPLIFFYLMFVILPMNIIKDKAEFRRVLHAFLMVGLIVAGMGFLSVLSASGPGWFKYRAMPFAFGDFNPLGGNHNAIAEVLAAVIPLTFLLSLLTDKIKVRGWYILAILFMTIILFLTLSRSGWLALIVELIILYFIRYRHKFNLYAAASFVVVFLLVVLLAYFTVWQYVDWTRTSNANRLLLTGISWNNFLDRPFIGHGLNSFRRLVGSTFVYEVEFGDPLESHGFVQKILTESGLLGLLSFLSLLGYLAYSYGKGYIKARHLSAKWIIACLIMMLGGMVVFELFSTSYFLAVMWLPIGVGLRGVELYGREESFRQRTDASSGANGS